VLGIIRGAFQRFGAARASGAAASVAYYSVFSLFPLLLALIAGGSLFLGNDQAYQEAIDLVSNAIPVSQDLIRGNIRQVLQRRGTFGLVAVVGLIWSATGVFTNLARHINRAWSDTERRGFLRGRLTALAMLGVVAVLLVLSVATTTLFSVLPRMPALQWGGTPLYQTALWKVASGVVPLLLSFGLFLSLYRWVPNTSVPWKAALWGAGIVALVWEAAKRGFAWYLNTGLARYSLVYGSLGAVVALMFWLYLSAWITFFGAHLTATIADRRGD
jgi:membrane protein